MTVIVPDRDLVVPVVNVRIDKFRSGTHFETVKRHNLAVTSGRNLLRDLLNGDSVNPISHFAVGTGTTGVQATDAGLQTEVFRAPFTQVTKPADGQLQVTYYLASGSANGNTISEAGLFNASSGGTMYARVVFTGDAKTSSEEWTFTWTLSFTV